MRAAIKFSGVSKSYGNNLALNNFSLQVNEGDIYGFIGPNGAGKSTAIRLLLNFINKDKGNVEVLGLNPLTEEINIKKQTGYVSSDTFMYADMRVKQIFDFTMLYHRVTSAEKLNTLITALEIDVHKKFEELSFGNRKKIAIACALLHSPKLIILDEPSNGLDPVIRNRMYDILRQEQKSGATIFFSSHVLSEVQQVCTRIGLIKKGEIITEKDASDFTHIGYRKVSVTASGIDFGKLTGVADLKIENGTYHFMYFGKANELISFLAQTEVKDFRVEEPELESVFMHYFNNE